LMNYDLWKTGWYDAEPDIDYTEFCPHEHNNNREAVGDLIYELYSQGDLNKDFVQEQLEWLAQDYGINFDFSRPLNLVRSLNS